MRHNRPSAHRVVGALPPPLDSEQVGDCCTERVVVNLRRLIQKQNLQVKLLSVKIPPRTGPTMEATMNMVEMKEMKSGTFCLETT